MLVHYRLAVLYSYTVTAYQYSASGAHNHRHDTHRNQPQPDTLYMETAPALIVQERSGRGRGLVAARELHAGETVLNEPPLMLTPSLRCIRDVCCCCLRYVDGTLSFYLYAPRAAAHHPGTAATCSTCNTARFCSPQCHASSQQAPDIHSPWLCRCVVRPAVNVNALHIPVPMPSQVPLCRPLGLAAA